MCCETAGRGEREGQLVGRRCMCNTFLFFVFFFFRQIDRQMKLKKDVQIKTERRNDKKTDREKEGMTQRQNDKKTERQIKKTEKTDPIVDFSLPK